MSSVTVEPVEIVIEAQQIAPLAVEVQQADIQFKVIEVATGIMGPPGPAGIPEEDMQYTKRIDWISDSQLYKGEAQPGTSESAASWRIKRITIGADDDVTEVYAGGTAEFDKVWANRASLTYV